MISVKNRVPTNPNRVQIAPISGNTYTWSRADNPTEIGTPWDRSTAQLMQADIRTLPIASGQTIAAKDVVNVVSGQITKAGMPNQAIALQAGTAGQSINIIYSGIAELTGITASTTITSTGVLGYSPQDGWLWVRPWWDGYPYVIGNYTANNTASRTISLGFTPSAVFVFRTAYSTANGAIEPIQISMATAGLAGAGLTIVSGGFSISNTTGGLNTSGNFNYVALK